MWWRTCGSITPRVTRRKGLSGRDALCSDLILRSRVSRGDSKDEAARNRERSRPTLAALGLHASRRALRALLVLVRLAMVGAFREEWPDPSGRLGRAADRRIARSRATRAVAEQDRDRLFIGPGWLKEPRVRITRKGRRR